MERHQYAVHEIIKCSWSATSTRCFLVKKVEGSPIYRQERPTKRTQVNGKTLWLWRNDKLDYRNRGWYVAGFLGNDFFTFVEKTTFAYCDARPGEPQTFPEYGHVPFYKTDVEPAIKVISYTKFLEQELEATVVDRDRYYGLCLQACRVYGGRGAVDDAINDMESDTCIENDLGV